MSHQRGSVSASGGGRTSPVAALGRPFGWVRDHLTEWPRRYVGMRVENGPP